MFYDSLDGTGLFSLAFSLFFPYALLRLPATNPGEGFGGGGEGGVDLPSCIRILYHEVGDGTHERVLRCGLTVIRCRRSSRAMAEGGCQGVDRSIDAACDVLMPHVLSRQEIAIIMEKSTFRISFRQPSTQCIS